MASPKPHFDTLAIHAGQEIDPSSRAVMQPIVLSSTFSQPEPGRPERFEYSRSDNPTRHALEQCIAALEGGKHGLAFASGSAAGAAVLQTLKPGDHVVACDDVYGGTYRQLARVFGPLGIAVSWVDMTDMAQVARTITDNTRLIWAETPTNPLLKVIDLKQLAKIAKSRGVLFVVDNTFATPALQTPLSLGADVVVHSTTKYLNGHSDVVGGALVTSDDALAAQLRFVQNALGAVPSPFDCYLVLRGLKTLPVRMERHCKNAAMVASYLEGHPAVARVFYPGLPSHPQYEIARLQLAAGGGMVTAVLRGGLAAAKHMLSTTQIFVCAESLGGVESLIELPALMTHAGVPKETRDALGIADGLVRLSVGLEADVDLRADLEQALHGL